MEIIRNQILIQFLTRFPTHQDGSQNHDKVYGYAKFWGVNKVQYGLLENGKYHHKMRV